ncbi:MAG: glycosyltransferase [Coprococcus sp.]
MTENNTNGITLSVVMPAYNEGKHIYDNLLTTSKILSTFVKRYEIIAVNDGSSDNTNEQIAAAALQDSHIISSGYSDNKGKGHAIAFGIDKAKGIYTAFLDSDLELSPKLLKSYLNVMKSQNADIVIGSKQHPESKLHYPVIRKIMSYGYYIILKLMFRLDIHDTQTGIKLFKSDIIKPIAKNLTTDGYAFDIEILVAANKQGCKIIEAPIELNYSRDDANDGRRIKIKDIIKVFNDTVAIKKKYKKR